MEVAATITLNALTLISILALVGLGLTISFGLMNVINLAHGEFLAFGAFTVYLVQSLGGSFWLGLLVAPLVGALLGLMLEWLILRHLYQRAMDTILATWGVSLILQQTLELVFGRGAKPIVPPVQGVIDLGIVSYPFYRIILIIIATFVLGFTLILIRHTRFGLDIRTVIQNRDMAEAVGIDTRRTYAMAFAFGAAIAALAGALVSPMTTLLPQMGINYLANAFFVVIVGGAGSVVGVVAGSTFVGGLTSVLNYQIPPSLAQALVLFAAIVLVRFRPNGLVSTRRYG